MGSKARLAGTTAAGLAMCAALGALVGVSGFGMWYAEGTSYLSNDPKACANCHIMNDQFDSWQKSPHHAVAACNDCHVPHEFVGKYLAKAEHGWRHSRAFTMQDFDEPIRITPEDRLMVIDNCVRCHTEMVADVLHRQQATEKTLYAPDPRAGQGLDCIRCHAGIGHGPKH